LGRNSSSYLGKLVKVVDVVCLVGGLVSVMLCIVKIQCSVCGYVSEQLLYLHDPLCAQQQQLATCGLLVLLQVYGIVTRCSLVRPKLVKSVHYCPNTGVTTSREYRDITALTGLPTGTLQMEVFTLAAAYSH
jgi:hypothetical protein